jgi:hypothetical protein
VPQPPPPATTTAALNASASFSATDQNIALNATITANNAGAVNEGVVLFQVLKSDGVTGLGLSVRSTTVNQGNASVSYVLPGGTAAAAYFIKASYLGTANFGASSDTSHTLTVSSPALAITSGPQALPATADVGVSVDFFVGVNGTGNYTYNWNFGDGTAVSLQGAPSVNYAFPVAGTYVVGVTVTDPATNATVSGDVTITITSHTFTLSKQQIQLDLTPKDAKDIIVFVATFPASSNYNAATAKLSANVGGVAIAGSAMTAKTAKKGLAVVTVNSHGGGYTGILASSGLGGINVKSKPVTVVFTVFVNGSPYQVKQAMTYKSTKNKGTANQPK